MHDIPDETKRLLEENLTLAKENNVLLKKLYRDSIIGLVIKVIWFAVVIGLPFALYFYILEPYLKALGSSYGHVQDGIVKLFWKGE
ncbi:hypothetical protein K2X96_03640 [Patescibacteria group bacterium]|nr:hypothetical protein [Patescibacteria group bacterium]